MKVEHITTYRYSKDVNRSYNLTHLLPRSDPYQSVTRAELKSDPEPTYSYRYEDYFKNNCTFLSNLQNHRQLTITTSSLVETKTPQIEAGSGTPAGRVIEMMAAGGDLFDISEFCCATVLTRADQAMRDFAAGFFTMDVPLPELAERLMHFIYDEFSYSPGSTSVDTLPPNVFASRKGVCQDYTHVALALLRAAGLPCRYVSGYIETARGGQGLVGSDESHAWFSVYDPALGWLDYDPTNGKMRTDEYIANATGRDYSDISPVRGVIFGGGNTKLDVRVSVRRL